MKINFLHFTLVTLLLALSACGHFDQKYPPVTVSRINDSTIVHRFAFNGKMDRFNLLLVKPDGSRIEETQLKRFRSITMENLNPSQAIVIVHGATTSGINRGEKRQLHEKEFTGELTWFWSVTSDAHEGAHFNLEIAEKASGNSDPVHMRVQQILIKNF